jgi:hypothetical protein
MNHELVKSDSGQPVIKFVVHPQEKPVVDPFLAWLRDEKSIRIDWSAFGLKMLKSESNDE